MKRILAILALLSLAACSETANPNPLRPPGTGGIKPPKPLKIVVKPGPDKQGVPPDPN